MVQPAHSNLRTLTRAGSLDTQSYCRCRTEHSSLQLTYQPTGFESPTFNTFYELTDIILK
jgi:hypothetical protein